MKIQICNSNSYEDIALVETNDNDEREWNSKATTTDLCVTGGDRPKDNFCSEPPVKEKLTIIAHNTSTTYNLHNPSPLDTITMKTYQTIFLLFALVLSAANAFNSQMGSSFVVTQRPSAYDAPRTASPARTGVSSLHMGGKVAKFGVFSPAVYGAKIVLGTARLNKLRGKGISLHSQTITDFCIWCVQ